MCRCFPQRAPDQAPIAPRSLAAAGPPLTTLEVAQSAVGLKAAGDSRLYVPADLLYSLRLAAGTAALVRAPAASQLWGMPSLLPC